MINLEKCTKKLREALDKAIEIASVTGHTYVGTEHIVPAFMQVRQNVAASALIECGVSESEFLDKLRDKPEKLITPSNLDVSSVSPAIETIFKNAEALALEDGSNLINAEHVMAALLDDRQNRGVFILEHMGVDIQRLRSFCV